MAGALFAYLYHRSSLRKSWDGDCFDQDLLQDLLLVKFEKVLVVKKIYIVVKFEKVVVVVVDPVYLEQDRMGTEWLRGR